MRFYWEINRGSFVTKSTILTKRIMLGVIGWQYTGKSCVNRQPFKKDGVWKYTARNRNGERIVIGNTMQEAEEFCLKAYKRHYDSHPEDHDWLPDPYKRKKVVSKVVIINE